MTIHIENLKFQAILGILDFERKKEQDIIINLTIEYDYKKEFIDYALVATFITNHMKEEKFFLIEEALNSLEHHLKKNFPLIQKLFLKITKPSILPNCQVSVSSIS